MAINARPGGPTAQLQPSPEGLGIEVEEDPSAVGAALNRSSALAVSLERTRISCHAAQDATAYAAFIKENRMKFANATNTNRKSGVA